MVHVFQTNTNNFKRSILPRDGILAGTTTPRQSQPGSIGNEGIAQFAPSSRSGASQANVY